MDPRPYESLTYRGQVRRLRALAREALPTFGLPRDATLGFLHHGENTTFRVRADGKWAYVLRIHRPGYQSGENIASEVQWLGALRRDTDLVVPEPVLGRDGAAVQTVSATGVPGERRCVLLRWIPGRFSADRPGRLYYERLGALMGRLHAHARTWERPPGFTRKAWDADGLLGASAIWGSAFAVPDLDAEGRDLLTRGIERVTSEIAAFGQGSERYGLIHADLHMGNVLFADGRMGAIDFDDCGEGWFVYDIVVAAAYGFRDAEKGPQRLDWFLRRYREHSPIEDEDIAMIETFWAARRIAHLGWVGTRSDNPRLAEYLPEATARTCAAIRAYLDR